MRWPFGPPHLTLKKTKTKKTKTKKTKKTKHKKINKKGLGPSEVAPSGHLTWPLNPPKKTKKQKTQKQKNKQNKKTSKNELCSYQSNISYFLVGVQKFPFLTTWPRNAHPQNTIKIGVSAHHFLKNSSGVTNGAIFGQINQIHKFQLSFFPFFFSFNNKNTKICWNPYFYSVLANQKREFSKINFKQRNLKNPICAPFFLKRLFLANWPITGHKKTQNDNWAKTKIAWNPYF